MPIIARKTTKIVKLKQGQVITARGLITGAGGEFGGISANPDTKMFFQLQWIGDIPVVVVPDDFTADAVLRDPSLTSFTADAIFKKTSIATFSADAVLGLYDPGIDLVQQAHAAVSKTGSTANGATLVSPTAGNLLVASWYAFSDQVSVGNMSGWNLIQKDVNGISGIGGVGTNLSIWWKISDGTEGLIQATGNSWSASNLSKNTSVIQEFTGVSSLDSFTAAFQDSSDSTPGVSVTPTAGRAALILTYHSMHSFRTTTPKAGVTEDFSHHNHFDDANPQHWGGHMEVSNTSGSYDVNPTSSGNAWTGVTMIFNP